MSLASTTRPKTPPAPRTMTAMRLAGPTRFEPVRVERPDPGPMEALVRIEGCGVCGSNLDPWLGQEWHEYPFAPGSPGHEAWGVVEGVGPGYEGPPPGERVAMLSEHAFAEYDTVHHGKLVPLPEELAGRDVPAEPLACAMNVMERAEISPGDQVAVVGVGYLGALLIQMADRAGATVRGLSRREFSREVARRMGARSAHTVDDAEKLANEMKNEHGRLCDVVIEAAGAQEALDAATTLTRVRGRLVIAGYHQSGPRHVNMQLWNWRGIDVINAHERDPDRYVAGMKRAARAMAEGRLDPGALHTHELPLEKLNDAMQMLRDRPDGFAKAIVRPTAQGGDA